MLGVFFRDVTDGGDIDTVMETGGSDSVDTDPVSGKTLNDSTLHPQVTITAGGSSVASPQYP